ncbi:toxin Cry1Ac domain D-VI-related protein [Listeria rocourtiae]|uniref:toxin Cry1Ac domain D-VI-related protein n=1 Tax=Listeria rocourtiae TaxID=647910 RepID=UPI003D2F7623
MKKKQMKKLVSTLTVASILGTSIVTPFNVLAETPVVKAAKSATAAIYVAPPTQNKVLETSPGPFLSMVRFDGKTITVDLKNCLKGYGVRIVLPDGTSRTFYHQYAAGVSQLVSVDVSNQNLRSSSSFFSTQGLYPTGLVYPNSYHTFYTAQYMGYQYDQSFGQKVYDLFQDGNLTTIGSGVTQAEIDAAKAAATNAPASPEKDRLVNLTNQAQTQFTNNAIAAEKAKQDAARTAVNGLFNNNTPTSNAIKSTTDQAAIDAAQALVNKVTDATVKASLQSDVNKAQGLLDAKNAAIAAEKAKQDAARTAINGLFNNNTPTSNAIKSTTDQAAIDAAQALVNKVTDATVKAGLQGDVDKAQDLLDAKTAAIAAEKAKQDAARTAVNELFNNNMPTSNAIKSTTNQAAIDAAQVLVNKVTDATVKAGLQNDVNKAQGLLDAKNAAIAAEKAKQDAARTAVNDLFNNNTPTSNAIKPVTDQAAIDAAQALVNKVTDATVKAGLQSDVDKAQGLLDAKNAAVAEKAKQDEARTAVNDLFNNNTPTSNAIKPATDQAAIDAAQALVDKVTDSTVKEALQADVDEAQSLLDDKNATKGTIRPNDYTIGTDKFITGSYTGDVAKVSLVRGFDEYTGATVKNGEFSFYTVGKAIKKTDKIYVVAYDKNGKELSRELVKFVVVTEGTITPIEMTIPGDNNITGTYTGDVARIEVSVNDGEFKKGGTVANGSFKFYSYGLVTKATDKVVVKAYDSAGKLLDTKTVKIKTTIPTTGTVTTTDYTLGTSNITGSYTGDVKSVKVTVGTTVYSGGTINSDGTFKFYVLDKIKSVTDTVSIAAYDKTGKLLDSKAITVLPK